MYQRFSAGGNFPCGWLGEGGGRRERERVIYYREVPTMIHPSNMTLCLPCICSPHHISHSLICYYASPQSVSLSSGVSYSCLGWTLLFAHNRTMLVGCSSVWRKGQKTYLTLLGKKQINKQKMFAKGLLSLEKQPHKKVDGEVISLTVPSPADIKWASSSNLCPAGSEKPRNSVFPPQSIIYYRWHVLVMHLTYSAKWTNCSTTY